MKLAILLVVFSLECVFGGQQEIFHHTECKRDYVKVGCFNNQDQLFKDVVATTLKDHPQNIGQGADWNYFNKHLHSLACICYDRALKGGYKYFAIGNYEICYGGKDVAAFTKVLTDKSQVSDQCLSNYWYTECVADDVHECSGEADSIFVYELRSAIPTQPAPVDGGYSLWSNWTACDRTCGAGRQERERTCTNPPPSHAGKDCSVLGESTEIRVCQVSECGIQLSKGKVLKTSQQIEKSYSFSLDIKPMGIKVSWSNIFRASAVTGNCCKIGQRIPALFFHDRSTKLHICSSINDNGNHVFDKEIPIGKFTNVQVKQALRSDGKYYFSILYDGKLVYTVINNKPRVFKNVKMYGSDPYHNPANAVIRNFKFESPIPAEYYEVTRNKFLQTIPKIEKTYELSVNIKPTGFVHGWSNILRITSNNENCCKVGSRIPALFIHSQTTKLHVTNGINGNGNLHIDPELTKDKFTNVKVKQTVDEAGTYRYSISLDDKEVYSVINRQPMTYTNAKVFIGDNFYPASKAIIEDFLFQSPLPSSYYKVTRNEFIREIPVISKSYRFTLDIKPLGLVAGWSNILRVVSGGIKNCCSVGNRIPALFFFNQSTKLHVCNAINNNGNKYFNKVIPMGKFTNVKIQQLPIAGSGNYQYTVLYDDEQVYTIVNTKPREFTNAKVFVGDKFHPAANAIVRNFDFQNL